LKGKCFVFEDDVEKSNSPKKIQISACPVDVCVSHKFDLLLFSCDAVCANKTTIHNDITVYYNLELGVG